MATGPTVAPNVAAQRQMASVGGAVRALRGNVDALKTGMLSAFLTIATGGSKLEAVFDGLKYGIMHKVLGPLGLVVGVSFSALSAIKSLAKGFAQLGIGGAGSIERLQNEFRTLLRGMEAAKQKVAEIRKFSDATPFRFLDVAQGAKALESLTRGALSTRDGMKLTGDAAAVMGTTFNEMAVYVGRAYDALASGRPIGDVAARLQELGGISGATRNQIESMQASGAGFSETWRVLETDLRRSSGAMADTSKTLEGLKSTLEDTEETMSAGFAAGFLDGEKTATQGMTDALNRLIPVTDYFGRLLGGVVGVQDRMKAKMLELATSIPGVETGMKAAGTAIIAFNAAVVGLAGAKLAKFGLGAMLSGGLKSGSVSAAKAGFAQAGHMIGQAFQFALAGKIGNAFGFVRTGMSTAVAAVRAGGMTAALAGLRGGFTLLGTAVRSVFTMLGGWPVAVIALAATSVYMIIDRWNQAAEALRSYTAATDEMVSRLNTQASAIQTADDLSRAYNATLAELGQAHRDAGKAAAEGNEAMEAAARERITRLRTERAELDKVARAALRKSEAFYERQTARRDDQRQATEVRRSGAQDLMGGEARLKDLQAQREEMARLAETSKRMLDGLEEVRSRQREAADSSVAAAASYRVLEEELGRLEETGRQLFRARHDGFVTDKEIAQNDAAIERVKQSLVKLDATANAAGQSLRVALGSENEIAILEAKINLYNEYGAVIESVAQATQALNEAGDDEAKRSAAQKQLQQLQVTKTALEREASRNSMTLGPGGAGEQAAMQARVAEMKSLATEKEKVVRLAEQDRLITQQQLEIARRRRELELDIAERMTAALDNAYEAELRRFDIARHRRALERDEAEQRARILDQQGKGGAAAKTRQQAQEEERLGNQAGDAARQSFERDMQRQRDQSRAGLAAGQMGVAATSQRRAGNIAGAQALEEAAARAQDEAERPMLERRFRDQGMSEDEAKAAAGTEIGTRAAARQQSRDEENKQTGFARSASAGAQAAEDLRTQAIQAEIAGHADYADALREAAIKTEQAATFQERVNEVMRREGVTKEEAEQKVKKADATNDKQRQMEQSERKKKRDLAKEGVESENKARRAEMGGNDEKAARVREKQARKEREKALKEQGFSDKEAAKQAKQEERDARRKRRQDSSSEAPEAPKADDFTAKRAHSLQRIGGGGGSYGPGAHARQVLGRMDTIIRHLAAQARTRFNHGGQATPGGLAPRVR